MHPLMTFTLATVLQQIAEVDPSNEDSCVLENAISDEVRYARRNRLVYSVLSLAGQLGYPCGINLDWEDPERRWLVAYIELPTGQVSWHLPVFSGTWDGHKTAEKYSRIRQFAAIEGCA